jgi:uncharacterized delta-60 repeat protein
MRKLALPIALALLAVGLSPAAAGAAARLDPSFAGRGFVEAPDTPEWGDEAPAPGPRVANYPGGRLVVGGHSKTGFAVYRYLADGRPDPRFGDDGVASVLLPGEHGEGANGAFGSVSAVAVQPDGKILVTGLYTPYPVDNCEECEPEYEDPRAYSALARLTPNGRLDTHFGGSRHGHRHEGVVFMHSRSVNQVAVHGGKIYLAGDAVRGFDEFGEAGYVARLDLDGQRDRSFNRHRGAVYLPPSKLDNEDSWSSVGAIRFDSAGRIYAGGYDHGRFMLARLGPSGRIDRGFGRRGFVLTQAGAAHCHCSWGRGLARDRHGRLLLSGYARLGDGRHAVAVARYEPSGRLDPSFGHGGIVLTRVSNNSYGDGILVRPDGRIVVAGSSSRRHVYDGVFTVVRYRPDGRRDRSFFGDGVFTARFFESGERAMQPLRDRAGRLVVAGETVVARFPPGT